MENDHVELPLVVILLLTKDRTDYAVQTIHGIMRHLKYDGEMKWYVCDNGSYRVHVERIKKTIPDELTLDVLRAYDSIGGAWNTAIKNIFEEFSHIYFRLEDDMSERCSVEPMRLADLAQVLTIERESFKSPWSQVFFEAELGKSYAGLRVARIKGGDYIGPVLGYICFWLVADELQITNLAVHPEYRHRSIGWQLLLHALELGHAAGARLAVLEVGQSNRPARALYERLGFVVVHKRPCYYPESREDGLVMELKLNPLTTRMKSV